MDVLAMLRAQGVQITHITADSRQVVHGSVFLAYAGEYTDGRKYIALAIKAGAVAVLWDSTDFAWQAEWAVPNVAVENLKAQASEIASAFYGAPTQKLAMLGVTGTNGKTTVSHWLAQAFNALNQKTANKTAVIGTVGNGYLGALTAAQNTTPDACELQALLANFVQRGAARVAMEVSSHGLAQGRVNGVHFAVAVFTNLSRDHLDYHQDMVSYGAAKRKLFDLAPIAVVNVDDDFGSVLAADLKQQGKQVLTYGIESGDVRGLNVQCHADGMTMEVHTPQGNACLKAGVVGHFNAYNLLAVLASLLVSHISLSDAIAALATLTPVAGRMQTIGGGAQPLIVVDYAHTPDALEKALATLKAQTAGKLLCVFGCGGNRDKGKRPLMGAVAEKYADAVIVTSDNPRDEDAEAIIKAITQPMQKAVMVEVERKRAIQLAVLSANAGDTVLIAGKGHETTQEIAGVKTHFSDVEEALLALEMHQELFGKALLSKPQGQAA